MHSRVRILQKRDEHAGESVVYWMSRDQRVRDNHALVAAQEYAKKRKLPLLVFFNLYRALGPRLYQQFAFMIEGLKEVEQELGKHHIGMIVMQGDAENNFRTVKKTFNPSALFFDFSPLREARALKKTITARATCPCFEVDTHNIVPAWIASQKEEWAAHTLRRKLDKVMHEWLLEPKQVVKHPFPFSDTIPKNDWEELKRSIHAKRPVFYAPPFLPGEMQAQKTLNAFIQKRLSGYAKKRNDPNANILSDLSPYLHFGQIASIRAALEVQKHKTVKNRKSVDSFCEEIIVRKELADNFCLYNKHYDSFTGLRSWAQKTLNKHRKDKRTYVYSLEQFERAQTHDAAWNAAQMQMIKTGKMHGYMRMYWAKKILEWTKTPEDAIQAAITLNDTYELDGYDPNGYVGIMWSIGGVHDRPWFERPVFGLVRYMNTAGLKNKMNLVQYTDTWQASA
ncbi:deoxyribodipyrimidine photo-lyase [Candidatus Woesebacteria bacterium]|nr:deoxyribodipyrimidine photo-lyase [Candidatus Woesebacteria bacterium]